MNSKVYKFDKDKIRYIPLHDIHVGANDFDEKAFLNTIEYIRTTPNTYWSIDGDCIENIIPGKISPYSQNLEPHEQVNKLIEYLQPIKHRGLFAIDGNHVARTKKSAYFNIMSIICNSLGIEYRGVGGYVVFKVNGIQYNFAIQHGASGGKNTETELYRMKLVYDAADVYMLGHNHDLYHTDKKFLVVDKKGNETIDYQVFARSGSYLGYADYARNALYELRGCGSLVFTLNGKAKGIKIDTLEYMNGKLL